MADRFGYGEIGLDIHPCRGCEDYDAPDGCKSNGGCGKPTTNADRLRAMTDEELATEIVKCRDADDFRKTVLGTRMNTTEEWLDWLKSPVIEDIPAADVHPVRHGRWERASKSLMVCTACGNCVVDDRISGMFYCPNCGAKMDEEEDKA